MPLSELKIDWNDLLQRLGRLMDAGEQLLARQLTDDRPDPDLFRTHAAFLWKRRPSPGHGYLAEVPFPDLPDLASLVGIDEALRRLRQNTLQFVRGFPANNVLLWGERGGGKSSSVKGLLPEFAPQGLRLVEVQKEDLFELPVITARLRELPYRFILFCDDLSFDETEVAYRELKALLEGGIQARPENVLVYATSNRRHLMPERFRENVRDEEIHPEETVSEKLSLSDRFGITLGFYPMPQETYLAIIRHLAERRRLHIAGEELEQEALQWALLRGARSGRVARQFIDDLSGRLSLEGTIGKPLD